jgi:hypothetical protein
MLTRRTKEIVSSMGMESRNSHVVAFPDRRFGDRETQLHAIHERESPPTTALVLITSCLRISWMHSLHYICMVDSFGTRRTIERVPDCWTMLIFASDDQIPMKKLS